MSYLGMEIEVLNQGMSIEVNFYVKQLLNELEQSRSLKVYMLIGMKETFVLKDEAKGLMEKVRIFFTPL